MRVSRRLHRARLLFLGTLVTFGSVHSGDAGSLEQIRTLIGEGEYVTAQSVARSLLVDVERRHGATSVEVADTLDALVEALWRSGKAQEPETRRLAERALEVRTDVLGATHESVADSLNNLAVIGYFLGEFDAARQYWERALTIREATTGPDSLEAAQLMNNLGNLLQVSGDLNQAAQLYARSLAIREKELPADHPLVAQSLNNLGVLSRFTGDYARALPLAERAVEIKEDSLGPDHPKVAESLVALANLLWETGDYTRALPMLERAQKIWEKSLGPEDVSVAATLNNRAEQLRKLGRLEEARGLFERALAIWEQAYEPDHPDIALCLSGLAYLLEETGDYDEALRHQRRAVEIRKETMGNDNPELAASLHNLGTLLTRTGEFSEARPLLEQAVSIRRSSCGSDHPWGATSLNALAVLRAFEAEEDARALELALEAERISRDHLRLTGRSLSEQHALSYATSRSRGLDLALTFADEGLDPEASRRVLDALIRSRAVVLDEVATRNRDVLLAADSDVARLAGRLAAARSRLANLTVRGPAGDDPETYLGLLDRAREEKELAERELASASAVFARDRKRNRSGLSDVMKQLPEDAALISFVRFDRWDLTQIETDGGGRRPATYDTVPTYLAFVLRSGRHPVAVPLGTASELSALVNQWKSELLRVAADRRREVKRAEADYREIGARLRRRVWDPLVPHVGDAARVFLVPDGVLNLVSWAALPLEEPSYLIEAEPVLHYLSAERDLLTTEAPGGGGRGLLALGGPDYEASATEPVGGTRSSSGSSCAGFDSLRFSSLPAAAEEAREIAAMWREAANRDTVPQDAVIHLSGHEATETAFKAQAPGRRVLHLATHGFFLDGDCSSGGGTRGLGIVESASPRPRLQVNLPPLLQSGLALAGANRRTAAAASQQDGLLTAEEIASLDLTGVEWAVLSACDTGLGELHAGEGVLGLRRAMQVAGVRALIMSLWPVDDAATRRWMRALYEGRLNQGLDTAQSVRRAGLTVLHERRSSGESTHPFYWSAFVAAGDWR